LDLAHNRSEDFTLLTDQREEELKKYLNILARRPRAFKQVLKDPELHSRARSYSGGEAK